MRQIIAFALLLVAGCGATSPLDAPVEASAPTPTVPPYWTMFGSTFMIQDNFDAIAPKWQDAEAQCVSNGARLPTSDEWDVVFLAGFEQVSPPHFAEWIKNPTGAADGVAIIEPYNYDNTDPSVIAFRCARDVPPIQ